MEKENSEFKPVKLHLKIDLVSHPARAEGLVNMIYIYIYIYICINMFICIYNYVCMYICTYVYGVVHFVIVNIIGNGLGDPSLYPGQYYLHQYS